MDQLAVHADLVRRQDALADMGRQAVDRNAALQDQFFHLAARAQPALGQHLVQLGRVVVGRQLAHRLGLGARNDGVFVVVLLRDHEAEQVFAARRGLVPAALALAGRLRLAAILAAALLPRTGTLRLARRCRLA